MAGKPKARKDAKKPTGRPKKNVDPNLVSNLAQIGCTVKEIAAIADCSVDVIERRFAEVLHKGRQSLNKRLRMEQIRVALGGNVTMLIWLGKQYLGQSEKAEISGPDGGAVQVQASAAASVDHLGLPVEIRKQVLSAIRSANAAVGKIAARVTVPVWPAGSTTEQHQDE